MSFTLINETPFPGINFIMLDGSDHCFHVIINRSTYLITADGILSTADKQAPVAVEDEFFGESYKSSVKQESDLAFFKPLCDVIVNCTAHAPKGPPVKQISVGITMHNPEGKQLLSKFVVANCMQYWENAPLIEKPNKPIRNFMGPYAVQCLGIIGRTWQPRVKFIGTYDDAWREQRYPYLPKDFDFRYFNCAHPDLQIPYPSGDEEISLYNICSPDEPGTAKDGNGSTVMKFKLPAQRISLALECEAGKTDKVIMDMDTLIIDTDGKVVSIVHRKLLPVGEGIRAARVMVD